MLRPSLLRRVLWGQRLAHYVPPVRYAGWVDGVPLLRHAGGPSVPSPTEGSAAFARLTGRAYHPSAAPPLCIEDVNEPVTLTQVTPCDLQDTTRAVQYLEQRRRPTTGREAEARVAGGLQLLVEVVAEHRVLLAGAESLQTGLPLATTLAGIDHAVAQTTASLSTPPSPSSVLAAASPVVFCMTPAYHSLAWGLEALTALLLRPPPAAEVRREVVWLPAEGASLSVLWLLHLLQQRTRRPPEGPAPCVPFHVLLTGDARRHVLPVFAPALPPQPHRRLGCSLVTYGLTVEAAAALQSEMPRPNPNSSSSSCCTHVHPQHLGVAVLVGGDGWLGRDASLAADEHTHEMAAYLFQNGLCPPSRGHGGARVAPMVRTRRVTAAADGGGGAAACDPTVSLLLVPPRRCLPLLQDLVRELSGCRAAVGHSLDRSSVFGPLRSAAHREAAVALLRAAVAGEAQAEADEEGRGPSTRPCVRWQHVAGGFAPPMSASRGFYYVPSILYTTAEVGGGGGGRPAGAGRVTIADVLHSVVGLTASLRAKFETTAGSVLFICSVSDGASAGGEVEADAWEAAVLTAACSGVERIAPGALSVLTIGVASPSY